MRRTVRLLTALATGSVLAVAALAGCGGSSGGGGGAQPRSTWVPQREGQPPGVEPHLPGQPDTDLGNAAPQPADPDQTGGPPGSRTDPNVVADHLDVPWGLAMLPDGSALVGERPTGRVVRVKPRRSPVQPYARLTVDPTGDGGLLGLAVSPSYDEDGLVFAYLSTRTDNRVVRFSAGQAPTPILTGIPHGRADNGGRIGFGPDGDLYVGTGDAGRPALAAQPASLAGKILRITVFGQPAPGNPRPRSAVYASGFRDVTGLCWDDRRNLFATDSGARIDELDPVVRGGSYGWPAAARGEVAPLETFTKAEATVGGCAAIGFGVFVGGLAGQVVFAVPMNPGSRKVAGDPQPLLRRQYGRLRTVVAAADGALWITTSNRDGLGRPVPVDDRVLRVQPPSDTTNSPV